MWALSMVLDLASLPVAAAWGWFPGLVPLACASLTTHTSNSATPPLGRPGTHGGCAVTSPTQPRVQGPNPAHCVSRVQAKSSE